jgi:hypothetical protein
LEKAAMVCALGRGQSGTGAALSAFSEGTLAWPSEKHSMETASTESNDTGVAGRCADGGAALRGRSVLIVSTGALFKR